MVKPYVLPRLEVEALQKGSADARAAAEGTQALWDAVRLLLLAGAPDRAEVIARLRALLLFWLLATAEVSDGDPAVALADLAIAFDWTGLEMSMDDWEDLLERVPPSDRPH